MDDIEYRNLRGETGDSNCFVFWIDFLFRDFLEEFVGAGLFWVVVGFEADDCCGVGWRGWCGNGWDWGVLAGESGPPGGDAILL